MMNAFFQQAHRAFRRLHGLAGPLDASPQMPPPFELARRHRVLGLWVDEQIPESWRRAVYGQALHAARLTDEAARIDDALRSSVEGLRLVKGPALSEQAWPQNGLRCYDDLDFRCEKSSLPALASGLAALGYQVKAVDDAHRDHLWHFGWGLEFRNPDGVMVEVNHRMFPAHFPWPDPLTRFSSGQWAPLRLAQADICCPLPAMHLLLACAHAAWHGWERLGWMVDIAGLLVRHPGILHDASSLAAPGSFPRNALNCGCAIASEIFGPLPGLEPGALPPAAGQVLALQEREAPAVPAKTLRRIHRQLMRPNEVACYTLRRLLTPGDSDFRRWRLSGRQRGLYWVLRPLRLLPFV